MGLNAQDAEWRVNVNWAGWGSKSTVAKTFFFFKNNCICEVALKTCSFWEWLEIGGGGGG